MKELTTAERKVYDFIKANQPVADTEIGKAFAKSVPRAKEFLPRLQRNGYISVSSKEKHGNVQILFYSVKSPLNSKSEDATFEDTFTKMGTDTTDQTTTTTEEALQTTTEEAPTTTEEAPATELDNPFGGIAENLRAQQEAPQEPISPVATSGQFSEEEGEQLYREILSARRYGQIGFSSLKNLIDGVILGDTDPKTFFEVFRHYYLIMSGREVFTNEVIPNKEVRLHCYTQRRIISGIFGSLQSIENIIKLLFLIPLIVLFEAMQRLVSANLPYLVISQNAFFQG